MVNIRFYSKGALKCASCSGLNIDDFGKEMGTLFQCIWVGPLGLYSFHHIMTTKVHECRAGTRPFRTVGEIAHVAPTCHRNMTSFHSFFIFPQDILPIKNVSPFCS